MEPTSSRRPRALNSIFAALGILKSRAFGLLNPKVSRTPSMLSWFKDVVSIDLSAHFMMNFLSLVGNFDVSVQCEIVHTLVFIDAIFQISFPVSLVPLKGFPFGSIQITDRKSCMDWESTKALCLEQNNLIASSDNVSLAAGTPGQFYDFIFPSRIKSGWWIWKLECLSSFCTCALCPNTIQS